MAMFFAVAAAVAAAFRVQAPAPAGAPQSEAGVLNTPPIDAQDAGVYQGGPIQAAI